MDRSELLAAGIARQAELLADGTVSSRELTETCLERIEALEPRLNAFRVVLAERARERADAGDRLLAAAERAPLLGVPIAVKDDVGSRAESTDGSRALLGFRPTPPQRLLVRLLAAGAVVVGHTNIPEFAIAASPRTPWGAPRNPWDPAAYPAARRAAPVPRWPPAWSRRDRLRRRRLDPHPRLALRRVGLKPQRGRISLMPDREHWHRHLGLRMR